MHVKRGRYGWTHDRLDQISAPHTSCALPPGNGQEGEARGENMTLYRHGIIPFHISWLSNENGMCG